VRVFCANIESYGFPTTLDKKCSFRSDPTVGEMHLLPLPKETFAFQKMLLALKLKWLRVEFNSVSRLTSSITNILCNILSNVYQDPNVQVNVHLF
jgi:hypothetical protein